MIRTHDDFIKRLTELYARNVSISKAKNADYASDGDPFKNFRTSEIYGIPVTKAILVRMSDKMSRIANLLDKEAQVRDESVLDTLSDLANYAMIMRMYIEHTNDKPSA